MSMLHVMDARLDAQLRRHDWGGVSVRLVHYLLLVVFSVIFAIPLLWMLSTSLKPTSEAMTFPPQWIPSTIQFSNYLHAWESVSFGRFFFNSFVYALFSTAGVLFSCSLAAYALARLHFRFRDLIFYIVIATLMLPPQVTLIPIYSMFTGLHWVNTLLPLIVPQWFGVNAFSVFLLRQFFMTLPHNLDDAARIDGCGEFGIWWRIVLPLSRPALGVVALFQAIYAWNDFFGPLIYETSQANFTVPLGLTYFQGQYATLHLNWMMAMSIVTVLPIFVVFFLFQKYFIQGITLVGVSR